MGKLRYAASGSCGNLTLLANMHIAHPLVFTYVLRIALNKSRGVIRVSKKYTSDSPLSMGRDLAPIPT